MESDSSNQERKPRIIFSGQPDGATNEPASRPRVVNPIVSGIVPPDAPPVKPAFSGQNGAPKPSKEQEAASRPPELAALRPEQEEPESAVGSKESHAAQEHPEVQLPHQPGFTSPQVQRQAPARLAIQTPVKQDEITDQKPRILQISAGKPLEPAEDVLKARLLSSKSSSVEPDESANQAVFAGGGRLSRDDPDSAASWAQEALTEAEKDNYASRSLDESRMADDIIRKQATRDMTPISSSPPAPFEAPAPSAAGPKSVDGVAYSVRGLFEGIKKKLMGV